MQHDEELKGWLFEQHARAQGFSRVAGVDEAGRGPLAGPVVAAACILPQEPRIEGIKDSKQLLPSQRYALFLKILEVASYGIGIVDHLIIDQVNILRATFEAMVIAISRLSPQPDHLLIDGNLLPPIAISAQAIVKGDTRSPSIAAASIIAKVTRDRIMEEYDLQFPQYGFKKHKGYGTREHLAAIQTHGLCPIHRKTFKIAHDDENRILKKITGY